jgi:hypothetical protein
MGPYFLQADDIGAAGCNEVAETLPHAGAQTVDVPGDEFHGHPGARFSLIPMVKTA